MEMKVKGTHIHTMRTANKNRASKAVNTHTHRGRNRKNKNKAQQKRLMEAPQELQGSPKRLQSCLRVHRVRSTDQGLQASAKSRLATFTHPPAELI